MNFEEADFNVSDKMKQKIIKHAEKLHNSHNDYEYLIRKFNYLNTFYKDKYFPNLIQTHQNVQERLLEEL